MPKNSIPKVTAVSQAKISKTTVGSQPTKSHFPKILFLVLALLVIGGLGYYFVSKNSSTTNNQTVDTTADHGVGTTVTIKAEVWADNWFAFYDNGKLIKEDSTPITTEKSFNSETFTFTTTYPLNFSFIVKDYKANDTGLEYIGTDKQQMGDGGLIAQFTDTTTGKIVAMTGDSAKYFVAHRAPLDKACADASNPVAGQGNCMFEAKDGPNGWHDPGFNDSAWKNVTTYSESQVKPKDGYDKIKWNSESKLIWSDDLLRDNSLFVRFKSIK